MAILHALCDPFANALCERSASQKLVVSGQKKNNNPTNHTGQRHSWLPTGVIKQSTRMPMGEMGEGGMYKRTGHPGWDVPPSSPSQKGRIQGSPGLSPEVEVRTGLQPSRRYPNCERAERLLPFRGGRTRKQRMLFSILGPFAAAAHARSAQDEALPGSEREGRNVGL